MPLEFVFVFVFVFEFGVGVALGANDKEGAGMMSGHQSGAV